MSAARRISSIYFGSSFFGFLERVVRKANHYKHLAPVLGLIAISIAAHHIWFSDMAIFTYGDWFVDFPEKAIENFNLPQAWASHSLGCRNIGLVYWPLLFLGGLFVTMGFSPVFVERVLYMWPVALFTPLFMYAFAYHILKSRGGAFTSAVIYTFNAPFLVGRTGILTSHMVVTFTPLLLLVFFMMLEKRSFLFSLIFCLLSFVIGVYDFRFAYLVAWVIIFYMIFHFIMVESLTREWIKKNKVLLVPIILLPVMLNCYWLPSLFQTSFAGEILTRGLFGSGFVDIVKSFYLFLYLWTGTAITAFEVRPILYSFFPIPLLAFGYLAFKREKNNFILFFILISLIGIFLSKMDKPPFPHVYGWLYWHFPGFNAFRESTKFYFYISLGYAVIIGSLAKTFLSMTPPSFFKKTLGISLVVFINAIFLWNAKPLVTGEIRTLFIPRKIPADYLVLKDFLQEQDGFFRTLYVPRESRWGFFLDHNPKMSHIDMLLNQWKSFSNPDPIDYITDSQMYPFTKKYSKRLLALSGIKYVIVPIRDVQTDDDFFIYYGNNRKRYIQELDRLPYLTRLDIGTKELVVFQNESHRPHIYLSSENESLIKNVPWRNVHFERVQSTHYKIRIEQLKTSMFLNFSELYDPSWALAMGDVTFFGLSSSAHVLPEADHFRNPAMLNSFFLNVDSIKKNYPGSYHLNPDGSIDIELSLFFKPQKAIQWGVMFFGIVFFCLVVGIIFMVGRRLTVGYTNRYNGRMKKVEKG